MRIISLKLSNFQGIKEQELVFDGKNASIFGDNATGKTTIYNAFTWLLTGNASTGVKNFTPKTTGAHQLEHSAEAIIETEEGAKYKLKKVFHEVYTKKRGSTEAEFTGHATDYYIDDVPTKEKDFNAKLLLMIGDAEQVKTLTMPFYFPEEMKWSDRRKILLDVCGDISDEDILLSNSELKPLADMLEGRTVDDMRAILASRCSKLNKDIESIPIRIDEANKAISDAPTMSQEDLKSQIENLGKEIDALMQKRTDLKASDGRNEYLKAITEKKAEIESARAKYNLNESEKKRAYLDGLQNIKNKVTQYEIDSNHLESEINRMESEIADMTKKRDELSKEWDAVNDMKWDDSQGICPTCHRPLEQDEVEKLKADFNLNKSQKLETITEKGQKVSKEKIEKKSTELSELKEKLSESKDSLAKAKEELAEFSKNEPTSIAFEETNLFKELNKDLTEIKEPDSVNEDEIKKVDAEIVEKRNAQDELKSALASYDMIESQKKRIEELRQEQKSLSAEYEKAQMGLHLCELFTKTKVEALDEKINSKFKNIRFRLFQEQVNGGIKDDCEVLIPCDGRLVPFAFANNASRINAGLEVIHTLSDAWGIKIPVFVDNAEAVTRLDGYSDMQVIRLVVSEKDKELKMIKED